MKKFLSMLLALSVVFTYTFGAAGSVFAAEELTVAQKYENFIASQIGFMEEALTGAVNELFADDEDGIIKLTLGSGSYNGIYWTADGLTAIGKSMIADLTVAMKDKAEEDAVADAYDDSGKNAVLAATGTKWTHTSGSEILTRAAFKTELTSGVHADDIAVMAEIQYDLTKKAVKDLAAAVDASKYSEKADQYPLTVTSLADYIVAEVTTAETMSGKAYVEKVVELFNGKIDKVSTSSKKTAAESYTTAYDQLVAALANTYVKTTAEEEKAIADNAPTVQSTVADFNAYALNAYKALKLTVPAAGAVADLTADAKYGKFADNIQDITGDATAKTVFGVKVANPAKATGAEVNAINDAFNTTVKSAVSMLEASLTGSTSIPTGIGTTTVYQNADTTNYTVFMGTLVKVSKIDEVKADLDKAANSKKATYSYGTKVYDDAKVNKLVADTKELLDATFLSATPLDSYIDSIVVASKITLGGTETALEKEAMAWTTCESADTGLIAFDNFKADSIKKMFSAGDTPQTAANYKATFKAEAEKEYLKATYSSDAKVAAKWLEIAKKARTAINAAETEADVNVALDAAKTEFAKLALSTETSALGDARTAYKAMVGSYATLAKSNTKDKDAQIDAAAAWYTTTGTGLIDCAVSVAEVESLYADAKVDIDSVKSTAELDAAKTELDNAIKALSYTVTLADYDKVMAIYNQYTDYVDCAGATAPIYAGKLSSIVIKAMELKADEYDKKLDDMAKALDAVGTASDADLKAYVAKKAEVEALIAEADTFAELEEAVEEYFSTLDGITTAKYDAVEGTLGYQNAFWNKEVEIVNRALVAASNENATVDAAKEAVAALGALSEAQKLAVQGGIAGNVISLVEKKVADAEEAAKWTDKDVKAAMYDAAKTTSYTKPTKTSVKLTAKANVAEIKENGYTVKYRFYQKGPKKTSYKLWKTTTSNNYTFKGLKKGTHYFKVKISVYDAEGKLVAYKYTNYRYLNIK